MAISRRDGRLLLSAGLLLVILPLYLLLGSAPPLDAPARPGTLQVAPPPPPAPPPPAPSAPDLTGLRLNGLLASGAIVGSGNGNQRLVLIGREAVPGLILRRIELNHAVFAWSAGELRLGFDGAAQAPAVTAPPRAAPSDDTLPYRLGLAPHRQGGRIAGFAIRRGASLPALERAGLRPGDVILAVNGSAFDEERMLELPWQIANSSRLEFEVKRGGRRVRMALDGG